MTDNFWTSFCSFQISYTRFTKIFEHNWEIFPSQCNQTDLSQKGIILCWHKFWCFQRHTSTRTVVTSELMFLLQRRTRREQQPNCRGRDPRLQSMEETNLLRLLSALISHFHVSKLWCFINKISACLPFIIVEIVQLNSYLLTNKFLKPN